MEKLTYINTDPQTTWVCEKCQGSFTSVYYNDYPQNLDDVRVVCRGCFDAHLKQLAHDVVSSDDYEVVGVSLKDDMEYWEWNLFEEWRLLSSPKPVVDYSAQPQVSGFFIMHTRATDHVFFGPFASVDEAHKWHIEIGVQHGVAGPIVPLMNPHGDPRDYWWIPRDMSWTETIKPKSERTPY